MLKTTSVLSIIVHWGNTNFAKLFAEIRNYGNSQNLGRRFLKVGHPRFLKVGQSIYGAVQNVITALSMGKRPCDVALLAHL